MDLEKNNRGPVKRVVARTVSPGSIGIAIIVGFVLSLWFNYGSGIMTLKYAGLFLIGTFILAVIREVKRWADK
jgi:hypothetical protein